MSSVISVENISKVYRLGQIGSGTFADDFKIWWAQKRGKPNPLSKIGAREVEFNDEKELWALRDVSFEVEEGQALGIIGRNGAGKSTLLKILSRVTAPTSGNIGVKGRIASLLEVGTGFHPDLTGRENIFLNGAILGMSRLEVQRKFDEIVNFAEINKFIDTPVKRYSSGMYVRLAFAVAAHLDPEILVIDEVLAVGDAVFQQKCLGKMGEVAQGGRTVLFVSHNMGAITQLCPNVILLKNGQIEAFSSAQEVVRHYLSGDIDVPDIKYNPQDHPDASALITRIWIADTEENAISGVDVSKPFNIGLQTLARRNMNNVDIAVRVHNGLGQPLFTTNLSDSPDAVIQFKEGITDFLIPIPEHFLAPDVYSITVAIHQPFVEVLDQKEHALSFQVKETGSKMWRYRGLSYGNVLVDFSWRVFLHQSIKTDKKS